MQTNLKWGYLYWQPISLNHPQQGADGQSAGIACKENRRDRGPRSRLPAPTPAQLCGDYRLALVYVFDSLLFYVLVKLARCFMRQVCSKTICQPSLVTESLAFDTNLGVRFWVSLLEGGAAGSRNSLQMLDERLAKPSGQTLGEVYLPAFFFLRFCFNWAFATLCGDKSGTGRKTLDSDLSHASCVDIRQVF